MSQILKRVVDAVDVETFLVCQDESEGRRLAVSLLEDLGFRNVDVVFAHHNGLGARIRVRASVHRCGDRYGWLELEEQLGG